MKRRMYRTLGAGLAAALAVSTMVLTTSTAPADAVTAAASAGTSGSTPFLEPYYVQGDLTGDHQITSADLTKLIGSLGAKTGSANWSAVSAADLNGDGVIDMLDVAALAQKAIFDDGSFDLIEASALDMQKAMNAGVITSVELTKEYLKRIADYASTVVDTSATGRALNAIISTGGQAALAAAAQSDALRAKNGAPRSMLDGIPILLKDNYDTKDMPTTAGCACWTGNQTSDDAFMVSGLRADGAVILGKASMDEFAYGFVSQYSAGSPIVDDTTTPPTNGTKLVASPYNTAQTAGGSSGGTGSAIAANLGAIGFGTDTGGSIRVPSSYNQLVGLRPTVGLTSRDGIVPLALSQDTGGPIGRSVEDVALALDAVVGTDPRDTATATADSHLPASYTEFLDPHALEGKSFAYFTTMVPPATATNAAQVAGRRIFMDAVTDLEAQGATVTAIDPSTLAADPVNGVTIAKILGEGSGSTNEFKHDLTTYINDHLDPDVSIRSLSSIVASGEFVPSYKSTYTSRDAVTQATYDAWIGTPSSPGTHTALIQNGSAYLTNLMDTDNLDAIIYPTALPYGTYSSNLRMSPNTGMPAITVPAGQTTSSETLPGAGVNLEFLGRDYDEGDLLGYAYSYEQATHHRTTPALYGAVSGDIVAGPGTDTDAPGNGSVKVTAPVSTVAAGKTFTVKVTESAADLYAYTMSVNYDPTKVQFVSATSGTTGLTTSSAKGGTVTVTHTKLGTSPGAEGATTLVTLTFKALATGASTVAVTKVSSVNGAGAEADVANPGSVKLTATKAATSLHLTVKPTTVKKGKKVTVSVSVTSAAGTPTGRIKVRFEGKSKTVTLKQGKAKVTFIAVRKTKKPQVRTRTVAVTYLPTGIFTGSSATKGVKIKR